MDMKLIRKVVNSLVWRLYEKPAGTIRLKLWEKPIIDDIYVSLQKLLESDKSLVRFGNGEFDIIWGLSEGYQKPSASLGRRLEEILHSQDDKVLVGITDFYHDIPSLRPHEKAFAYTWRLKNACRIIKLLGQGGHYVNTYVSRPYSSYTNVDVAAHITGLKKMWEGKDLYVIEGAKCRVGVGNDLFSNARQVYRIEAPSENAWDKYEEIKQLAIKLIPKGATIYMALGATATVLAYDLAHIGYRALDLGHLDIEYEYFIHQATEKIKIPGKYVNEVADGSSVDDSIVDSDFLQSIIGEVV